MANMEVTGLRFGMKISGKVSRGLSGVLLALLSSGCEPEMVVGTWLCASSAGGDDGGVAPVTDTIAVPWTTGFENEFCGYTRARGFCYADPDAAYEIVDAPVHSGRRAAAFSVTSAPTRDGQQARCVREGTLPSDAIYGAWYFVPALANNTSNWNLMHFQGGADAASLHGLWDVSLRTADDGRLFLYVFDFLRGTVRVPAGAPEVVPGAWFHVEFHLLRSADASGQIAIYHDGRLLLELSALVTDDSEWAQWYVGNYANALTPPDSTVYVDDVTIVAEP